MGIAELLEQRNARERGRLRQEGRQETQAKWEKWKAYHDATGRQYDTPPRLEDAEQEHSQTRP